MISANNKPNIISGIHHMRDFTVEHYTELLHLAKRSYLFVRFPELQFETRFVLWRHDCDYSLNRAYQLALIEQKLGIISTYFINPHCEFYNPFEKNQKELVNGIVNAGHDIGLHFDAAFYDISSENELEAYVANEALLFEQMLGVRPAVFSFHNPTAFLLTCEKDIYGGLMNSYSKRFKEQIPYCSDSNGYWRFQSLRDVLEKATDPCLQVLTHPGWWQEKPMPPRQRIFRSIFGRAESTMRLYDSGLEQFGRNNLAGPVESLYFLKDLIPSGYELYNYLWNKRLFHTLFTELWRLHERQINQICKAFFRKEWQVPAREVNTFFEHPKLGIDGWKLFITVFETSWLHATGKDEEIHKEWITVRNQLIHGRSNIDYEKLEEGCLYLCGVINSVGKWGKSQESIRYDGIAHLGSIGIPTYKTASGDFSEKLEEVSEKIPNFPSKSWHDFKADHFLKFSEKE